MKHALPAEPVGAVGSPPSRGRGLKLVNARGELHGRRVAPLAGAWIETSGVSSERAIACCRPPRGGVD